MAVPKARSGWAPRIEVAVESSTGSGDFVVDERLRADMAESLMIGRVASARIRVRLSNEFTAADAQAAYHADRRMIVRSADRVVFDGYPVVGRMTLGDTEGGDGFELTLEHVAGRLGRDESAQIIGRHMRDARIADGMIAAPTAWLHATAHATGLPCIFNMDGGMNCDPVPIEVDDETGRKRKIHIFADDSRLDAIAWTFARALRYLLHFYGCKHVPVGAASVMEYTDGLADMTPHGREAHRASDNLAWALLGRPDTLVTESTSLFEALSLLSTASGVRLVAETQPAAEGVVTSWRMWTDRGGVARNLRLASARRDASGQPVYDAASAPIVDLFDANNISASDVSWDARPIATSATVVGGVRRFEFQAELLPGWLPREGLDNVDPADRAAAKAQAVSAERLCSSGPAIATDPWYAQYHRAGSEFDAHWDVGRLWILNEAGTYDTSLYARNAPFDSYAPFDFSALGPGPWMRRRRCLLPVSAIVGPAAGVVVEVSFDAGTSWTSLATGYAVLDAECGIWLDVDNLLSITSGADDGTNVWSALVDQVFRLRVTALIESDQRLLVRRAASTAPSVFRSAIVAYASDRFAFVRHGIGVGSDSTVDPRDRDDSELMSAVAQGLVDEAAARAVTGRAVVPWFDTALRVGDRAVGIRGRGLSFARERGHSGRHACITGKRYHFGAGKFETELLLGPADSVED